MASVRIETEYIIQGVRDRTDVISVGDAATGKETRLYGALWENNNETLMKCYTVFGDPELVGIVDTKPFVKIFDKMSGVTIFLLSIGN